MKKFSVYLSIFTIVAIFFYSCSKDPINPAPAPGPGVQRLVSAVAYSPSDSTVYNYSYDAGGKLTQISVKSSRYATPNYYQISYEPNLITVTFADANNPGLLVNVKVLLTLNANKSLAKRIALLNLTSSGNIPTRTYIYDTTIYQYNADGIRIGATYNHYDSTAYDQISPKSTVVTKTGSITNTISGNNLVQSRDVSNQIQVTHNATDDKTYTSAGESITTFDYSSAFPNKMDFSNSIVLNEVNIFSLLPIAAEWKNLPNKATGPYEIAYEYSYNSDGLVSSRKNLNSPAYVVKYVYGK